MIASRRRVDFRAAPRLAGLVAILALSACAAVPQPAARGAEASDAAAVACVRVGADGAVTGAFLVTSSGDRDSDRRLIEMIRRLRWPPARDGEAWRGTWFPMPVGLGDARLPEAPAACAPPLEA